MASSAVALGLRAHSGWAVLVALSGPTDSPSVVDRRILQLCDPKTPGSKQPYHAAAPLSFAAAAKLVERCTEETRSLAYCSLHAAIENIKESGFRPFGGALLLNAGRVLPPLEGILASHALIHAAEGQLFRDALAQAAAQCHLALTGLKERETLSNLATRLGCSPSQLWARIANMGRLLGPPWREDQKYATLAAWTVLKDAKSAFP